MQTGLILGEYLQAITAGLFCQIDCFLQASGDRHVGAEVADSFSFHRHRSFTFLKNFMQVNE